MQFFKTARKSLRILTFFMIMSFLAISASATQVQANEQLTASEAEAMKLLNQARASQGLSALKVDMRLVRLGRQHAADMIKRNYFSHNSPEGQTPFDRLAKAGIRYRAAGENIAMNQSVQKAQEAWMKSSGHRANILSKNYTHAGIGIVKKSDGSLYLVQVFIGI